MNKKVFVLIVILMSVSLIGIISVQIYWTKSYIEMTENQFTIDVKSALNEVASNISERELNELYETIEPFALSRDRIVESELKTYLYQQIDTVRNETFEYSQTILRENYRVTSDFFENDSIDFPNLFSKEKITIVKNIRSSEGDIIGYTPVEQFTRTTRLDELEKSVIKAQIELIASRSPIQSRVSNNELQLNLSNELVQRGIDLNFKYGVYDNDLATPLKSGYFRRSAEKTYTVPLFADNEGNSSYILHISFPDKYNFLIRSIGKILGISTLFIIVLIIVFGSSLYQMIKQKKIADIKTDFINNMTHEFKTPIATINLALDAIKNPKIINDQEKVLRYSNMIREENKRMHVQVENVLRISQLEKNQLDVSKDKQNLHDLIEVALSHVDLLVNSREGTVKTNLKAKPSSILANNFHLTNVIINIIENAIKYSPEAPIIDVITESTSKHIVLMVKDKGMGMTKSVQKNIFKKFYREEKGNVHNVKGHGLGLAYVKKIIDHHQGTIHVESEKGKGSTFIVKLPLI